MDWREKLNGVCWSLFGVSYNDLRSASPEHIERCYRRAISKASVMFLPMITVAFPVRWVPRGWSRMIDPSGGTLGYLARELPRWDDQFVLATSLVAGPASQPIETVRIERKDFNTFYVLNGAGKLACSEDFYSGEMPPPWIWLMQNGMIQMATAIALPLAVGRAIEQEEDLLNSPPN